MRLSPSWVGVPASAIFRWGGGGFALVGSQVPLFRRARPDKEFLWSVAPAFAAPTQADDGDGLPKDLKAKPRNSHHLRKEYLFHGPGVLLILPILRRFVVPSKSERLAKTVVLAIP